MKTNEKSIITTEEGRRRGGEDGFIEPGDSGPIYIGPPIIF